MDDMDIEAMLEAPYHKPKASRHERSGRNPSPEGRDGRSRREEARPAAKHSGRRSPSPMDVENERDAGWEQQERSAQRSRRGDADGLGNGEEQQRRQRDREAADGDRGRHGRQDRARQDKDHDRGHRDREQEERPDRDRDRGEQLERDVSSKLERERERADRDRDRADREKERADRDKERERPERADRERDRGDKERDRGDKERDRGDKERDRGDKDRDRGDRERDRGDRDRERGDKERERGYKERERGDRDRERGDRDRERGDKDRERGDKDRERGDRERERGGRERERGDKDRERGDKDRERRAEEGRAEAAARQQQQEADAAKEEAERDRDKDRDKDQDKDRDREGERRERDRGKGRESKDRDRRRRSRGRRSRSRESRAHRDTSRRSRSPADELRRGAGGLLYWQSDKNKIARGHSPELTLEERDARTVFVWQMSARIRPRDLDDFFSSVGRIRDVRLIMDNKTRRSKGIAYVEFAEVESVQLAIGLTGTKLLGVPIQVQSAQAEKNRAQQPASASAISSSLNSPGQGPMRIYVGQLHANITEQMLKAIFEPFGKIDSLRLVKDQATGASSGYGFVTFHSGDDAKRAVEQLNGFELAGLPMKVGHIVDKVDSAGSVSATDSLEAEELDKPGVAISNSGRLALMAKLAEGTGLSVPEPTQRLLQAGGQASRYQQQQSSLSSSGRAEATQCFVLSNMFAKDTPNVDVEEIRDDVLTECSKHGRVEHCRVDAASHDGRVYVKCVNISVASSCVDALHGRYFSGRVITANYIPLPAYHQMFPDSAKQASVIQQLESMGTHRIYK